MKNVTVNKTAILIGNINVMPDNNKTIYRLLMPDGSMISIDHGYEKSYSTHTTWLVTKRCWLTLWDEAGMTFQSGLIMCKTLGGKSARPAAEEFFTRVRVRDAKP